jgi:tetratricopeptide (TPR) repeat protein
MKKILAILTVVSGIVTALVAIEGGLAQLVPKAVQDYFSPKDITEQQITEMKSKLGQLAGLSPEAQIALLERQLSDQPTGPEHLCVDAVLGVTKQQLRSVELIDNGKFDQALDELDDADERLERMTTCATLARNQRGYNYKTYAQILLRKGRQGDVEQANRNLNKAYDLFEGVRNDSSASGEERARAIHGLGVVKSLRGDYPGAVANFDEAISIFPRSPYVWYDRFLVYDQLAKQGHVDKAEMRKSLDQAKIIDRPTPEEIDLLEAAMKQFDH